MKKSVEEYEQILATMVRYLYDTGFVDSAKKLLNARLESYGRVEEPYEEIDEVWGTRIYHEILLRGPTAFVIEVNEPMEFINGDTGDRENGLSDLCRHIMQAFKSVVRNVNDIEVSARLELESIENDWRAMMLAEIETDKPTNQGYVFAKKENLIIYEGQKFGSPAEVEIAKALDRLGVMYLPNCLARVGFKGMKRENKYPDFLVAYKGRWGILEVDGKTYHTPTNATQDHERQRLLEQHGGIKFFTRYDAKRCMNEPDRVVREFLGILETK